MNYKEYCENQEVEFKAIALVNGKIVGKITASTLTSLEERFGRLTHSVETELSAEYDKLPENDIDSEPDSQPEGDFSGASSDEDGGAR